MSRLSLTPLKNLFRRLFKTVAAPVYLSAYFIRDLMSMPYFFCTGFHAAVRGNRLPEGVKFNPFTSGLSSAVSSVAFTLLKLSAVHQNPRGKYSSTVQIAYQYLRT